MTSAFKFERTYDTEFIHRCMTHPDIWPHLTDDGAPGPDLYFPQVDGHAIWVKVQDEDIPVGVFLLVPANYVCYEVHTALLPEAWGKAVDITKSGIGWLFTNTLCRRLITNVPEYNRKALALAKKTGMVQFGVNTKSFLKYGILHDQIMLGISKEG